MPAPQELDGYRYDLEYNHHYHRELSPAFLRLLTQSRSNSFASSHSLRYLELGYGMGVSLNIHAAASPGEYWGTDISPAHAASARMLARASGATVNALNLSFAELLKRSDLPLFDVIAAHGVWSWVSTANRSLIVELLKRHLAPGGLFFMSSVAMPAEAEIVPLQRLLRAQDARDPRGALKLAFALQAAGSRYFAANARAGRRLMELNDATPHYLVHEYLHEHWQPCLFFETAATLAVAGLSFAAGARLLDQYDEINFNAQQRELLASIEDPALRETARDFLRGRRQRYDLFIKGRTTEVAATLPDDQEFVLAAPMFSAIEEFADAPYKAIIDRLAAKQYRPKRLDELSSRSALFALIDAGFVFPAQRRDVRARAAPACASLNAEILRRSQSEDTIQVLASPVTGGGVPVSRSQRLFLIALREGAETPDRWVEFAHRCCAVATSDLLKEALFFHTRLPVLKALGLL